MRRRSIPGFNAATQKVCMVTQQWSTSGMFLKKHLPLKFLSVIRIIMFPLVTVNSDSSIDFR